MRAVLDTNVIVSAALTTHGTCARLVDMLVNGTLEICVDDRILDEYDSVLRRPKFCMLPENIDILMEAIRHVAIHVIGAPLSVDLPDSGDRPFLEVAVAAGAILVTGNVRHYPPDACAGVKAVTPAEFLELVTRSS